MFTCLVSFYFYFYFWTSLLMCEAPLNRHWLSSSGKSDEFSETNNEKPTATHWLINLNHTTLLWSYFYLYNKQMWHYFYLSWLLHVKFYFHKFGRLENWVVKNLTYHALVFILISCDMPTPNFRWQMISIWALVKIFSPGLAAWLML